MFYKQVYNYVCLALLCLAFPLNAQKPVRAIVKGDVVAPFTGNIYVSIQFHPERKNLSPEFGLGLIGPWASAYTGQDHRRGIYARAGLFLINGVPQSKPKNIWRRLYIKPELAVFQHHAGYVYPSRKINLQTGFFEDAINRESYDIKGACLILNIGKQIDFNNWVIDFSFGYGGMVTKATHYKEDPATISKQKNFVFPIEGPFPIYSINTFTDQLQGGIKLGYKIR
ncbi:MAG: hypothetical protein CFE21_06890 [Bacteroidetes bacterium B1(2017)]|nr:MAG: hypothetical protein CFE21_06890 [Bacteroidetes bacterium B1(2017)]